MRGTMVAIDLETTGLDPRSDKIIEIAAVRFHDDEVLDQWTTLVNPGRSIPAQITQLTGITASDVQHAPLLTSALPTLRQFINDDPILGHNVRFDLSFLEAGGLRVSGAIVDSYAIASVLLPSAPRYSLSAIAALLGIHTDKAHRALNDALMTVGIYQELSRRVASLPDGVIAEIVRCGRQMPWDADAFFEAALSQRGEVDSLALDAQSDWPNHDAGNAQVRSKESPERIRGSIAQESIQVEALSRLLTPDGAVADVMPDYEQRPQQVTMLRAVSEAFNNKRHIMIEAPTGVGKSLAYLIPAVDFAIKTGNRVVISTNTIALQEQIINKDIPLLQLVVRTPFQVAVLKGRANYLCPRRLQALQRRGPTSPEEMLMLARILVWRNAQPSGDRSDLSVRGKTEAAIWHSLSAEDEGCRSERCMSQMAGLCPFHLARDRAERAHLLVVNHALLLADAVAEGHILPDYNHLIIDEAHHLEEAITSGLAFQTDSAIIRRQLGDIGSATTGLLGEMLRQCRGSIPSGYYGTLEEFVNIVAHASSFMLQHCEWFFDALSVFITSQFKHLRSEYTQQIRLLPALREQVGWQQVSAHWDNLSNFTSSIADAMTQLEKGFRELTEYDIESYDDILSGVGAAARHLVELHTRLHEIMEEPDPNMVYWAELPPTGGRVSLHVAPLDVGALVQKYLWNGKDTIVMTSATLRTSGDFTYLKGRLGATEVDELVIGSPFDYKSCTLLYLVDDIPEPAEQSGYQKAIERGLLELCRATEGRALVLFTSFAQLRETASALGDLLAEDGIVLYDQSNGTSRGQLLEGFKKEHKSVLMGTRSFWEGVDIPGTDLSVVVITKLPFSVPSDPLFAARSERFADPFGDYSVPEAILRLRQGFGRLIRRSTDRGVVAVLDRRVISKRYGQRFLESLPGCTVRKGKLADLPTAAKDWLSKPNS